MNSVDKRYDGAYHRALGSAIWLINAIEEFYPDPVYIGKQYIADEEKIKYIYDLESISDLLTRITGVLQEQIDRK